MCCSKSPETEKALCRAQYAAQGYGHHSFVEGIKNGGLDLFKAAAAINKHG
jgi:hypothetical protein